ncbi:ATP-grasp domain-containing protein [Actinosynnema sp. NPDC051121]
MSTLVLVESNTTGTGRMFCAAARARGLRPVVFARDPGRYPYLVEDAVEQVVVDTTDLAAMVAACARLGDVTGVTTSSELAVERAAELARAVGVPHPPVGAVRAARDKGRLRALLRDAGPPGPDFEVARAADEAVAAASRIGYPVVVKPSRGTGSAGVRLCRTDAEVKAAVEDLDAVVAGSADVAVLVESYLDGPEFSVETFDGEPVVVVGKHLSAHPHFVELGHDLPARVSSAQRRAVAAGAVETLWALGLRWGAAHVELRLTSGGPRVVEVNPRLAGGMIPAAVAAGFGVDLVDAVVAKAAGLDVGRVEASAAGEAAIRFAVAGQDGVVTGVTGVERALRVPGVERIVVTAPVGTAVHVRGSFQDRLGCVVATGSGAAAAAERALGMVGWDMSPVGRPE